MNLLARFPFHALAVRIGWPSLRAAAFDAKFESGVWRFGREHATVVDQAVALGAGKCVLSLGCGANTLGRSWPTAQRPAAFLGLDLSREGLAIARREAAGWERFELRDMRTASGRGFDLFVFAESLYYLSPSDAAQLVARLIAEGEPECRALITICRPAKYQAWLAELSRAVQFCSASTVCEGSPRMVYVYRR